MENRGSARVYGVTVLTSFDDAECSSVFGEEPNLKVMQFAWLLYENGAHGIICSPRELAALRKVREFDGLDLITPGTRPEWASTDDQKRVATPAEAVRAGARKLGVGRPILKPPAHIGGPVEAAKRIAAEVWQGICMKAEDRRNTDILAGRGRL